MSYVIPTRLAVAVPQGAHLTANIRRHSARSALDRWLAAQRSTGTLQKKGGRLRLAAQRSTGTLHNVDEEGEDEA